jgi:hypothetical protein
MILDIGRVLVRPPCNPYLFASRYCLRRSHFSLTCLKLLCFLYYKLRNYPICYQKTPKQRLFTPCVNAANAKTFRQYAKYAAKQVRYASNQHLSLQPSLLTAHADRILTLTPEEIPSIFKRTRAALRRKVSKKDNTELEEEEDLPHRQSIQHATQPQVP